MYLDILLLQNLVYNYVIICGVAILLNTRLKRVNTFLGLSAGVLISLICFSFQWNVILSFVPFVMVYLVFMPKKKDQYIKSVVYFYCISIMISGAIYSTSHFISFNLTTPVYILVLFILSLILTVIYVLKEEYMQYQKKITQLKYEVEFLVLNQLICGTGYVDTGNHLTDHVTNEPIMIVPKSFICSGDIEHFLNDLEIKWRYTTYSVVNEKPKTMIVFRPNTLIVNNIVLEKGLIGLVDDKFPLYDFLLQPDFI